MNVDWNTLAKDGNMTGSFENGIVFLGSMTGYKDPLHHLNDYPFLHKDSAGESNFGRN
jgi:hypothetical protein